MCCINTKQSNLNITHKTRQRKLCVLLLLSMCSVVRTCERVNSCLYVATEIGAKISASIVFLLLLKSIVLFDWKGYNNKKTIIMWNDFLLATECAGDTVKLSIPDLLTSIEENRLVWQHFFIFCQFNIHILFTLYHLCEPERNLHPRGDTTYYGR